MDSRDHALTILTRLHDESHLATHRPAILEGITHSRWGASWNWRWRWVGDDEERRSPSPEPQTDSRSALPRKNRAWRRLRIVKRDESFSLFFFQVGDQADLGRQIGNSTPWLTERHGYDPTYI